MPVASGVGAWSRSTSDTFDAGHHVAAARGDFVNGGGEPDPGAFQPAAPNRSGCYHILRQLQRNAPRFNSEGDFATLKKAHPPNGGGTNASVGSLLSRRLADLVRSLVSSRLSRLALIGVFATS
jgi:hypothetical protein